MSARLTMYFGNWPLFFRTIPIAWKFNDIGSKSFSRWLLFALIWFDIFINMVTGGDPRETISSSLHKDRKSSWGAGFLINVIEAIDDDHGETSNNPAVGEGSEDNRELPGMARIALIIIWVWLIIVATAIIRSI